MDRVSFILDQCRGKILDVGFVACSLHQQLLKRFDRQDVFGLDIEPVPDHPNYKKGSAEKIEFESGFFDTVVAGELIEHLPNPEKFVSEASRVLKTGGQLLLTTPNRNSLVNRFTKNYQTKIHLSLFSKKELTSLLEKNGFEVKRFFCLPYTPESSPGSSQKWFYPIREALHFVLPQSLQEEMVVFALKK